MQIRLSLVNIYLFCFIFTTINRSFYPFWVDLRYLVLPLGVAAFLAALSARPQKVTLNGWVISVVLLYFLIALSTALSRIEVADKAEWRSLIILNGFNFFNLIALYCVRSYCRAAFIYRSFRFSALFLLGSMLLTFAGIPLPFNDYQSSSATESPFLEARICGYASDPNYVTLIFVSFLLLTLWHVKQRRLKLRYVALSLAGMFISTSRTVFLVIPIAIFAYLFLSKFDDKSRYSLIAMMLLGICAAVSLSLRLRPLDFNLSMYMRYVLWGRAVELFKQSPLIGNGLGSVRSFGYYTANWRVQCHSTFFQLLSEHGILGITLFFGIYFIILIKTRKSPLFIVLLIYLLWSLTYETLYLSFTAMYLGLIPFLCERDALEKKRSRKARLSVAVSLALLRNERVRI